MRRRSFIGSASAICLLSALGACVPAPSTTQSAHAAGGSQPGADAVDAITELVTLLDDARLADGCLGSLVWDDRLAAIALAHSQDMAQNGYFSHRDPLGRDLMDRMQAAGIQLRAAAENLALGPRTGREAFTGWRGSPGHNHNMMNCLYTHHGVGISGDYWTHVFMRPAGARLR